MPDDSTKFFRFDYESETSMSGDGSGDPDTHYIAIADGDGEEFALICHRASPDSPLDGLWAVFKELRADWIVDALNAYDRPQPELDDARREISRRRSSDLIDELKAAENAARAATDEVERLRDALESVKNDL